MYLEEIELYGFKTFVSNTKVILSKNITAIIGPNGSGKSNMVDAIRWILGETKMTLLRASESSDLIFSGSNIKSPLSVASVKMIFNNEEHTLPIKTPRFIIERRIYRNKESHYYLNGEESSLQSVLSTFNSGGIFGANFAIVGQGRVEEILLARPEEKKAILDKVAGIESFKKRREEAVRKLNETEENLIRVYDRLAELRKEANRIVSEAKKAHLYYMLVDKLKNLEETHYNSVSTRLKNEIDVVLRNLNDFEKEDKEMLSRVSARKKDFEEAHQTSITLNNEYEIVKQEKGNLLVRQAQLNEKENSLRDKIKMLEEKTTDNKLRLEKLSRTKEYLNSNLQTIDSEREKLIKALSEEKESSKQLEDQLDILSKEIAPLIQQEEEKQLKINKAQEERVKKEKTVSALETDIKYLQTQAANLEMAIQEAELKLPIAENDILSSISRIRNAKSEIQEKINRLYEERSLLKYRIVEIKKSMSCEDYFEFLQGTLGRALALKKLFPGIEDELNAKIINSTESLEGRKEGTYLISQIFERMKTFSDDEIMPMNAFLQTDSPYFDGIYYAENVNKAIEIFKKNFLQFYIKKIITSDGFVVSSPYEISINMQITAIKKREEMQVLEEEQKENELKINALETELQNIDISVLKLEKDLDYAKEINLIIKNAQNKKNELHLLNLSISEKEERITNEKSFLKELMNVVRDSLPDEALVKKDRDIEQLKNSISKIDAKITELSFSTKAVEKDFEEKKIRNENISVETEEVVNLSLNNQKEIKAVEEDLRNTRDALNATSLDFAEIAEREQILKEKIRKALDEEGSININITKLLEKRESLMKKIEKAHIQVAQKQTETEGLTREMEEKDLKQRIIDHPVDSEKLKNEISELKKEVNEIGLIDFTSVDEEEKIIEELNEKESVYSDVKTAKKELEKFIDETEKQIKSEFEKTLGEVEKNFAVFFKRMFMGGEASIEKLYDENGEVKGIELNVRLPGKRKQSLPLLSGGEKTITALAFLFALFKVKPSPFYVLDEVDAALDEDNVVRFCELLNEEAKTSQFIVITHNKETMQSANILYGVTMEEEGISKVVSMKFA